MNSFRENRVKVSQRTIAVVVTYNPSDGWDRGLQCLAPQVDGVVVVDNSPQASTSRAIEKICEQMGCQFMRNGSNLGLAEALNRGVLAAVNQGAEYVLTMDQDSVPDVAMVPQLHRALRDATEARERVGLVTPRTRDVFSDRDTVLERDSDGWTLTKLAITSGSLIPVSVVRTVGLFRADFFIDSVDQEFCLRLGQSGFKIVCAQSALLDHRLGAPRIHRFLGMHFIPTNHSAQRRFFMARNVLWTARLFALIDARTSLLLVFKLLKNAVLIAAFEDEKLTKLRATVAGLRDGILTSPAAIKRLA
jgi:rhamnosyltransferase